ncbi:hypothetical protein HY449_04880 [Candidatus Pacearchaeota archaeon]|nr:hypothetical protein [Candidatus Pacearchaeota archaeon]
MEKGLNPKTITGRINLKALEILEKNPEGVRWTEMLKKIKSAYPKAHPKTINGCVWKLVENFPDRIYKPERGLFRLVRYKRGWGEGKGINISEFV